MSVGAGSLWDMTHALLVTADPVLRDELLRLAAAAGVGADVAPQVSTALRAWAAATVVLVGADLAADLARAGPSRRDGVHVAAWSDPPEQLFRGALALGAESVIELPAGAEWLSSRLSDAGDAGRLRGVVVGVTSGSGGAGATTFACALAQVAARHGPTLMLDADPFGPGLDRVLGLEDRPGVHWQDLLSTSGRLGARALREAVPRAADLGVLTWSPGGARSLAAEPAREVLAAARRGHDTVVVDLPRALDGVAGELADRCDRVFVMVSASVTGVASASRWVARFPERSRLRLVVRGSAADPELVAHAIGLPVAVSMADQRGLEEAIDLGYGPVRSSRGPLGRAASAALGQLAVAA